MSKFWAGLFFVLALISGGLHVWWSCGWATACGVWYLFAIFKMIHFNDDPPEMSG